ncbi:MAG: hypothetical protein Q9M33_11480 [Robiginitomaculum sp.]|nr:hypothetical protein [Robiginitomaculum sp.]MDQ7077031.1 hypothetical protein [Robiginitomaculum sp.]
MTDKFYSLVKTLQLEDHGDRLINLEARVWQRLEASRLGRRLHFSLEAVRALPIVLALVLGGAAGARSMTSQDRLSAFATTPAYSVLQLVQ